MDEQYQLLVTVPPQAYKIAKAAAAATAGQSIQSEKRALVR